VTRFQINNYKLIAVQQLGRFSIEYRKPKPKKSLITNHKKCRESTMNLSKHEVVTFSWREARENAWKRVTIGFGFTSDCMKKWREFFLSQSCTIIMQNQFRLSALLVSISISLLNLVPRFYYLPALPLLSCGRVERWENLVVKQCIHLTSSLKLQSVIPFVLISRPRWNKVKFHLNV